MEYSQAPLLDRLIDVDPANSGESVQQRLMNARQIKALVVRDLENLLNSRRVITSLPESFRELQHSVVTYGLKDFTALNTESGKVRLTIQKDVEAAINRFEPRLQQVRVGIKTGDQRERKLIFQISAMLVVDPIREPVAFDTFFDVTRKEYVVSG
jgi:type VI secretion system protein ImpF